jgi:hypothetical protein
VLAARVGRSGDLPVCLAIVTAVQDRWDRSRVSAGAGMGLGRATGKGYGESDIAMTTHSVFEEIKVFANQLVDSVRKLIHEGNVRRIIIKNEQGHTFVEIPVSVAAVGAVFAPILAAVGALAAMAAKFTIVVEKSAEPEHPTESETNSGAGTA